MTITITVRRYYDSTNALTWCFALERAGIDSFKAITEFYTDVIQPNNYGNYSRIENGRFVYIFITIIDQDGMPIYNNDYIENEPVGPSPIIRQLNTAVWKYAIEDFLRVERNQ